MTADRNDAREGAARRRPEPEVKWNYVPRLVPGEYPAYCRSAKIYRDRGFRRWVFLGLFDVMDKNLNKLARLGWFMNLGSGDKPHVTRRSNYWAAWVKANGGPPKRRDRVSSRVFVRRYATVVVADTTRDSRQELAVRELAYSVIRDVLSWDTGGRQPEGVVPCPGGGSTNLTGACAGGGGSEAQ